jgi:cyclic pyranopterin phosphate synthase
MVKGLERGVSIEGIELVAKSGGRSGDWRRERLA